MEQFIYLLKAAFLGVVEGLTEFLPISSTAHLLILGDWINFDSGDFKVYEIVIQLGSILAVMWIFRYRLWQVIRGTFTGDRTELLFTRNLILAFLPAAVIGLILIKQIAQLLDGKFIIYAFTLVLGGILMLWVERRPDMAKHAPANSESQSAKVQRLEDITWKQALVVGFAQCLAMIPGTSRSGATIIAGMMAGIHRKTATEFSFFLAMPTMLGATVLSMYKYGGELSDSNMLAVVIGFIAAFISALLLVRALLKFISVYSYRPFGWYRIVLGLIVGLWVWSAAA
ncbi:undecaprenyl-diphosphate phosphatase [Advenella alkanexedens]|uniref:undecaprenyl-diphosphate phosphatase n=1 Tax=Advenella alkanexedens TaxID=1481665 RepID=UPI002675AC54|nr:undecaprenyl-diphosphate phosphatase [Advenella alkanexedens]WKU20485.1 undecaprenyl-diphosphate phosphatase [Advenella alkanexedens]